MINFFRKIRKQLADDNKPLKYMRYALGEIVLVVIGILIALSINNWNENRKESISKEQLVRDLILELETAKSSLTLAIQKADLSVTYGALFLEIVGENDITIPVDSIKFLAEKSIDKLLYKLTLSAYDESKSSGRLSLLENHAILREYSELFADLEDYTQHFTVGFQIYYTESMWDFRKKYGTHLVLYSRPEDVPKQFRVSDEEYRKIVLDPIVYGTVDNFTTLNGSILESLQRLNRSITNVISLLEEYKNDHQQ